MRTYIYTRIKLRLTQFICKLGKPLLANKVRIKTEILTKQQQQVYEYEALKN